MSIHHTLGPGVGFYGDGDEHLGTVYADLLQALTDCLTLIKGYITGNERHAIQHFQTRTLRLVQHHHAALGRHMSWGAVAAASKKLANISRRTSTSPIFQTVAAYPAVQCYQPQDHK